jgi:tetratricopeptide (TPR) repeat protein
MVKRLIVSTGVILLLFPSPGNAQRAQIASEQEQWILGEYWTVVKGYHEGKTAPAIKEMSAWPHERISKVQATQFQPEAGLDNLRMSKAEWRPEMLRAAAMLHTEVGLGVLKRRDLRAFQFHAGIADGWLNLADDRKSQPGGLRSRWNVAIGRVLLLNKALVEAEAYLDRLDVKFPNDAGVLLALGTARESRAIPTAPAEPLFERVLALDPTLIEARLRLARLALDRGDDAAAEKELSIVKQTAKDPSLLFLANLWLGQIRERQTPWTAAAELYVEAIKTLPDAMSAYVALSDVLKANGEAAQAAGVMDRFTARGVTSVIADPVKNYPLGLDTFLEARFDAFLAEARAMKDRK